MKAWSLLLLLLGVVALAGDDGQTGSVASTFPKAARDQLAWLRSGMRRGEVERRFTMDGGLFSPPTFRYYVGGVIVGSKVVMVDLTFQPDGMPNDVFKDVKLRSEWLRVHPGYSGLDSPKDILRNIGSAYFSGAAID